MNKVTQHPTKGRYVQKWYFICYQASGSLMAMVTSVFVIISSLSCRAYAQDLAAMEMSASSGDIHTQESQQTQQLLHLSPKGKHTKSLIRALAEIEARYNVSFDYDKDMLKDKYVNKGILNELLNHTADKQNANLDKILSELLIPFNLTSKKFGNDTYAIYTDKSVRDVKPEEKIELSNKDKRDNTASDSNRNALLLLESMHNTKQIIPSQDTVIRGKVLSGEDGMPLPGVSVILKGTGNGAITDKEGNFSISVPSTSGIIRFSYTGFITQEIAIGGHTVINVRLTPDTKQLNEVVAIGYGSAKKSDLTGAVANVKGDKLLDRPAINIAQALQGRVAGVDVFVNAGTPGYVPKVRIRGISSINSSIDPLYVVDGIIGVPANDLNPNDIESVEVLKDASATAIYGARGANGVILITTKRGLKGQTRISYDGYVSYGMLSKTVPRLNAKEYMYVYNLAFKNAQKYDSQGYADGKYVPNKPQDFPKLFDASGNPLYNTDWEKEVYKPSISSSHQLNVQGGGEKGQYSLSLGYTDQKGIMINSWFKRYSTRFTLDNDVKTWLRMGGSISLIKNVQQVVDDANGGLNVARMVFEALPILPVKYPDGSWGRNKDWPGMEGGENPVRITNERQGLNNVYESVGDAYALFRISPALEFKSSFGYNLRSAKNNFYSGRDLNALSADQKGVAYIFSAMRSYWQSENYFTWNKSINSSQKLTALLGLSWQKFYEESFDAESENYIDDFWKWHNLAVGTVRQDPHSGDYQWAMNSYFARFTYNIKDKYLFTLTGRYDGSSKFGKNNKYAFFPSLGAAWRLSQEEFLKSSVLISNLKLRASIGSTGNQEIGTYNSLQFLGSGNVVLEGTRRSAIWRTSFGNPNLKWERVNQADVGIELGLLNDRINLIADYYQRVTKDLLLNAPIPWSTGLSSVTQNIGSVQNTGIEITFNTVNIQRKDFTWTTNVNFASNKSKILKLGKNNDDIFPGPWFLGQTNILRVGGAIGTFWGYKRVGTWSTAEAAEAAKYNLKPGDLKWADLNKDGKIDDKDLTIIGRAYPKWTMNLGNTVNYRNFDFTFDIRFVMGVNTVNATKHSVEDRQGIASSQATVLNAWTPDRQNTYIAEIRHYNAGYQTHMDSWWTEDGSFIRGQNLLLGYTFPASMMEKSKIQKLRLYLSSQNLFCISKYSGYDPEALTFGGQLTQNIDFFQYPKSRTFNLGITLTF